MSSGSCTLRPKGDQPEIQWQAGTSDLAKVIAQHVVWCFHLQQTSETLTGENFMESPTIDYVAFQIQEAIDAVKSGETLPYADPAYQQEVA